MWSILEYEAWRLILESPLLLIEFLDVGPAHVTTDPQQSIEFIGNLTAKLGYDCPEMSNSGMELGIQHRLES